MGLPIRLDIGGSFGREKAGEFFGAPACPPATSCQATHSSSKISKPFILPHVVVALGVHAQQKSNTREHTLEICTLLRHCLKSGFPGNKLKMLYPKGIKTYYQRIMMPKVPQSMDFYYRRAPK